MRIARNVIALAFVGLLVGTLVFSHANRTVEDDYAALPATAEETTPLKSGDRAPTFTVSTVENHLLCSIRTSSNVRQS